MYICGLNKTTLLDYPEHLAATIFLRGCDFRCPFCQNSSLVLPKRYPDLIPVDEIMAFLQKRSSILEGVCITGGEPTIQKDLPDFIADIKNLGLKVKLDTNGNHPDMLKYLLDQQLLDYVAMDIKNSLEKYPVTVGLANTGSHCDSTPTVFTGYSTEAVEKSVILLKDSRIPYEFRTTIVKELHTHEDMHNIGKWLKGSPSLFLQSFVDSGEILQEGLSTHSKETLLEFKTILSEYINRVELRGIS